MIIEDFLTVNENNLRLLLLCKNTSIKTLRDIPSLEFLIRAKNTMLKVFKKEFNLNNKDIALLFHYFPSSYLIHIHGVKINNTIVGIRYPEGSLFVDDVIKNISLDPNYYKGDLFTLYK